LSSLLTVRTHAAHTVVHPRVFVLLRSDMLLCIAALGLHLTNAGPMAMEEFATIKSLGRFMLRAGDVTVAQGMVTKMQPG
jgi:hypothetical protein